MCGSVSLSTLAKRASPKAPTFGAAKHHWDESVIIM